MVTSISAAFGQRVVAVAADVVAAAELQETVLVPLLLRRPAHRLRRLVPRPVRFQVVRLRAAVARA